MHVFCYNYTLNPTYYNGMKWGDDQREKIGRTSKETQKVCHPVHDETDVLRYTRGMNLDFQVISQSLTA